MDELTQYLHLPEKMVAKELGICLTSLKKLCRQHGITRWPYRKLKSLDKKIAKAESGSGTGGEDAQALKAKADELKREKMAVAFTYGQKDPSKLQSTTGASEGDTDSVTSSDPGVAGVEGQETKTPGKGKKKAPSKAVHTAGSSSTTPSSNSQKGSGAWPFSKDGVSGIPTPPEEPIVCSVGHDNDIFAEAVADVMATNPMMDENGDGITPGWEGGAHLGNDSSVRASRSTAEVDLDGTMLTSVVETVKNGTVKMTIMLPGQNALTPPKKAPPPAPKGKAAKVAVSDADMKMASALASVASPRGEPGKKKTKVSRKLEAIRDEDDEDDQPSNVKFDLDDNDNDNAFAPNDLMESEFFSGLGAQNGQDGEAHDDGINERDDHSPSSLDSTPPHDEEMEDAHANVHTEDKDLALGSDGLGIVWDQDGSDLFLQDGQGKPGEFKLEMSPSKNRRVVPGPAPAETEQPKSGEPAVDVSEILVGIAPA